MFACIIKLTHSLSHTLSQHNRNMAEFDQVFILMQTILAAAVVVIFEIRKWDDAVKAQYNDCDTHNLAKMAPAVTYAGIIAAVAGITCMNAEGAVQMPKNDALVGLLVMLFLVHGFILSYGGLNIDATFVQGTCTGDMQKAQSIGATVAGGLGVAGALYLMYENAGDVRDALGF